MGLEDKRFGLKKGGLEAYRRFLAMKGTGFNTALLNRPAAYQKAFRSCWAKSTGWDLEGSVMPPSWNDEEWRNCKFEIDHLYGLGAKFQDMAEKGSFLPQIAINASPLAGSQMLPSQKSVNKALVGPDLVFNGYSLTLPDQSILATSGLPGVKDYRIKNKGPIPPGMYSSTWRKMIV